MDIQAPHLCQDIQSWNTADMLVVSCLQEIETEKPHAQAISPNSMPNKCESPPLSSSFLPYLDHLATNSLSYIPNT